MILQHCPVKYQGKDYGCGMGPIDPTRAFLDMGGRCRCGQAFKPYRKPKPHRHVTSATCQVTSVTGESYCREAAVNGDYCKRHQYLNYR